MVKAIPLLILLVLSAYSYGATIYHWVDKNGAYNFIDDFERIPSAYSKQVQIKEGYRSDGASYSGSDFKGHPVRRG